MENQTNLKQDCGCGDGCCPPKKKGSYWRKWIFIVIILAAGAIVTVKLVGKNDAPTAKCCETTETSSCCPQSASPKDSICCSQPQN